MRKILISLISFALLGSMFAQGYKVQKDKIVGYDQVVAVVEDTTITREDLKRATAPFEESILNSSRTKEEFERKHREFTLETLQAMVDRVIIVKEFRAMGAQIPQSSLDSMFEDDLKKNFNGDRSEFLRYLQSQNMTIKEYRKEHEEMLIVNYMQSQQKMTASEVSPAKILEYYEENKQNWYMPETVEISQISIKENSPELLKEKIDSIYAEIKKGLDFAEAAKKYSQDEAAKKGGDWGKWKKGQLNPNLDKLAFSLKAGEVGEPVIISNYAYIIKVNKHTPEGIRPLDEVREEIEWKIAGENAMLEYKKWLERLRKKSYIRYY